MGLRAQHGSGSDLMSQLDGAPRVVDPSPAAFQHPLINNRVQIREPSGKLDLVAIDQQGPKRALDPLTR
jgi:hypothetical protein